MSLYTIPTEDYNNEAKNIKLSRLRTLIPMSIHWKKHMNRTLYKSINLFSKEDVLDDHECLPNSPNN